MIWFDLIDRTSWAELGAHSEIQVELNYTLHIASFNLQDFQLRMAEAQKYIGGWTPHRKMYTGKWGTQHILS